MLLRLKAGLRTLQTRATIEIISLSLTCISAITSIVRRWRQPKLIRARGFSLVELLITLALMIIMIVMFTSRGSQSYQQQQLAACSKNLQQIYVALSLYATDNQGRYPMLPSATSSEGPLSLLVPKGTTDTEMFTCPGSKDPNLPQGVPFTNGRISYAYYMGWTKISGESQVLLSDRQVNTGPKKSGEPIFSRDGKSPGDNHSKFGGNLLSGNGEVSAVRPMAAQDLLVPTNIVLLNPKPR